MKNKNILINCNNILVNKYIIHKRGHRIYGVRVRLHQKVNYYYVEIIIYRRILLVLHNKKEKIQILH